MCQTHNDNYSESLNVNLINLMKKSFIVRTPFHFNCIFYKTYITNLKKMELILKDKKINLKYDYGNISGNISENEINCNEKDKIENGINEKDKNENNDKDTIKKVKKRTYKKKNNLIKIDDYKNSELQFLLSANS
jgi:hypothetical protein